MQLYHMNHVSASTILVVEDEIILREYLTELLELEGYTAVTAGSAGEAISQLQSNAISAAITDLHLGQSTGMEVLQYLQIHSLRVPCLLMSAEWNTTLQQQCLQAGAAGLIKKPFDNKDLLRLLREALQLY